MRHLRHVVTAAVACLLVLATAGVAHAAPATPTLVGIRAAHHPTFDRIVFDFRNGLPAGHQAQYVTQLTGDASGLPVSVAGRAVLRIRFSPAQAHDASGTATAPARVAFGLPDLVMTVRSGDFEGVTTYGIGLAVRQPFHVFTLTGPPRVVVDVAAAFRTVQRQVFFFDPARFATGSEPYFRPVLRPVLPLTPATGVMDRLFAGPTPAETARGLRFLASGATGFRNLSISDRIARVRLTGGCSSGGSTATTAGEIFPTLRQFASVDFVKIFDPAGTTGSPTGARDSIPNCLEP